MYLGSFSSGSDPDTGDYHLRARTYNPTTGRFLTLDPVSAPFTEPGISAFAYANNRPTVFIDPAGEFSILAVAVPVVVVAGGYVVYQTYKKIAAESNEDDLSPQETAHSLGYKRDRSYDDRVKAPAYRKGTRVITRDLDEHRGGYWKLFKRQRGQLKRVGTYDQYLKRRLGP